MGRAEGQLLHLAPEEMDLHLGVTRGEQIEREHADLEGPARRLGAAVEADAGALAGGHGRAIELVDRIAAEVEVVRRHPVVAPQELGQPGSGCDPVEAEAVGGLREHRGAAGRVEGGLEVLNEVEAAAACGRGEHRIGGLPRGGEHGVRVGDAVGGVADLRLHPGPPGADGLAVLLDVPAVAVLEVHDATVARRLERGHHPVHRGVTARARAAGLAQPGHAQRLTWPNRERFRQYPARLRSPRRASNPRASPAALPRPRATRA